MQKNAMAIGLLGVALLASCSDDSGNTQAEARHVDAVSARTEPVISVGAVTGEVAPRVQADLSFRLAGKIIERNVDVGDRVKAGQILARIDPEEQNADMAVARANLEAARAQYTQAQLAFDRQQKLFQTQVTARAEYDRAEEVLATAKGNVEAAEAQLGTAAETLSYTQLKADADGIVTARNAEVGQVAQAADPIFTLAHDGPRDALFDVVETLFIGRPLQDTVEVRLLSDPTRTSTGRLREISPTIDASTGTVRVKVELQTDAPMPLGAPVSGAFSYAPQNAIQLPWSSLTSLNGVPAVWVIDPVSRRTNPREVGVADFQTGTFVVTAGLEEGEIVVSSGVKFLYPDQIVSFEEGAE